MRFRICSVVVILLLAVVAGDVTAAAEIVTRLQDGKSTTFAAMTSDMQKADTIFVGEVHNDVSHHWLQLRVLKSLVERGEKVAVGLEMFQVDSQQALDDWSAGKLDEEGIKAAYSRNWSFDWSLYRDLFMFARDNHIPLIALNIPQKTATKVARQGFAALSEEERKDLPAGVTCQLNTDYTELLKTAFGQVFKHMVKQSSFTYFCEAQTLRNSAMARNLARFHKANPGYRVVVVAGVWHAVRGAISSHLTPEESKKSLVILPQIRELTPDSATVEEGDYLVNTAQ